MSDRCALIPLSPPIIFVITERIVTPAVVGVEALVINVIKRGKKFNMNVRVGIEQQWKQWRKAVPINLWLHLLVGAAVLRVHSGVHHVG